VAEQYEEGLQKIFYRATSSKVGLSVSVKISRSTDEEHSTHILLSESIYNPGVYFFWYVFFEGTYLATFFEDAVSTISQVYSICKERVVVSRARGPNVVG
jgi:hypothetical protein